MCQYARWLSEHWPRTTLHSKGATKISKIKMEQIALRYNFFVETIQETVYLQSSQETSRPFQNAVCQLELEKEL